MTSLREPDGPTLPFALAAAALLMLVVTACSSSPEPDGVEAHSPQPNPAVSHEQAGGHPTAVEALEAGLTALITLDADALATAVHPEARDAIQTALAVSERSVHDIASFEVGTVDPLSDEPPVRVAQVTYFDAGGNVLGTASVTAHADEQAQRWYYDLPRFDTAELDKRISQRFEKITEALRRQDANELATHVQADQHDWVVALDLPEETPLHVGEHGVHLDKTYPYFGRAEVVARWLDGDGEHAVGQRVPFVFEDGAWRADLQAAANTAATTQDDDVSGGGFETAEEALQLGHHALFTQDAETLAVAVHPSDHDRIEPAISLMDDIVRRAESISMSDVALLDTDPPRAQCQITYYDIGASEIGTKQLAARWHNGRWYFVPPAQ